MFNQVALLTEQSAVTDPNLQPQKISPSTHEQVVGRAIAWRHPSHDTHLFRPPSPLRPPFRQKALGFRLRKTRSNPSLASGLLQSPGALQQMRRNRWRWTTLCLQSTASQFCSQTTTPRAKTCLSLRLRHQKQLSSCSLHHWQSCAQSWGACGKPTVRTRKRNPITPPRTTKRTPLPSRCRPRLHFRATTSTCISGRCSSRCQKRRRMLRTQAPAPAPAPAA